MCCTGRFKYVSSLSLVSLSKKQLLFCSRRWHHADESPPKPLRHASERTPWQTGKKFHDLWTVTNSFLSYSQQTHSLPNTCMCAATYALWTVHSRVISLMTAALASLLTLSLVLLRSIRLCLCFQDISKPPLWSDNIQGDLTWSKPVSVTLRVSWEMFVKWSKPFDPLNTRGSMTFISTIILNLVLHQVSFN